MIKKIGKKRIIVIISIIILLIGVFFIPVNKGKTIFSSIIKKQNLYDSLSQERQELYDKMKIEYVNIKNRVTGTEPFNEGSTSNSEGVDVSPSDDYVRTLDVMKYTLELGIIPNTSVDGVTASSSFIGGVIKVRAKLPNQGTPILMTWEQDAWMQNISYNEDKTEIYAEYHVPEGIVITNANQNLTFTVKVGGYKETVTSDMEPVFEVWMEGNKPDNASSSAESLSKTDNRNTIISGKVSLDFEMKATSFNISSTKDNQEGHYVSFGLVASLWQPYDYLSDFRGVLYPTEKITVSLDGEMSYHYPDEVTGWQQITSTSPGATNLLNGTTILAAQTNCTEDPGFYPSAMYKNISLVGGSATCSPARTNSVFDGGTTTANLNNNKLVINIENYKIDGKYPTNTLENGTVAQSNRRGVFGSGNIEFFIPYYNPQNKGSVENQIVWKITDVKIGTNNYTDSNDSSYLDGINNNTISAPLIKRGGTLYSPIRSKNKNNVGYLTTTFNSEDGASLIDDNFIIEVWAVGRSGPYEGGVTELVSWNSNFFELEKYTAKEVADPEGMYDINTISDFGLDTPSENNIHVYYGIYKSNPAGGITTNDQANAAIYTDFDWYSTYSEAKTHGKVTAAYCDDPDNRGYGTRRNFRFNIHTLKKISNIGEIGIFRLRTIYYGDANRTDPYYFRGESVYYAPNSYIPSQYNDAGTIISRAAPEELGETILVIGIKTGVKLTSTDKDTSNQMKKAYDVQDNVMNLKITPTLTNGKAPSDLDGRYDNVIVKTIVPNGLSYVNGSASRAPTSVTQNPDGTTTIKWKYDDWQINHNPPSDNDITFQLEISSSLENNTSLTIKGTIEHAEDVRDLEGYRTSNYGVVISNLSGSRASKEIDKPVVDIDESFTVTSVLGNNNEENLNNVRSIEILPRPGDENGSNYHGNYTIKVTSLADTQKLYYTTKSLDELNLPVDRYGKITVNDVEFTSANGWTEVAVNGTIPANATAIATVLPTLEAKTDKSFDLQIIPSNNKKADIYGFSFNMTSNNLQIAVKSNIVVAKVKERKISGIVFEDTDNSNDYNNSDKLIKELDVELLDSSNTVIATTKTDTGGYYEFSLDDVGTYYIRFAHKDGYELIPKGTDNNSSKVNNNYITDSLVQDNTNTNIIVNDNIQMLGNINMGIKKKTSTLTTHHYIKGTTTSIGEDVIETVYYTDTYETHQLDPIPTNYRFVNTSGDPATGTVNSDNIEVIYYYELKPATLIVRYVDEDGNSIDITKNITDDTKHWGDSYQTEELVFPNHDFLRVEGTTSGTVSSDTVEVTYIYKLKTGTITTHHYLYENGVETTTELAPNDEETYNYTERYTTKESTQVPKNYELYRRTDNYTGIVQNPNEEVIYYYQIKDSQLDVNLNKTGTEEINKKDDHVIYDIDYKATVIDYIGDATITIVEELEHTIDEEKSNLDGGTYDKDTKTITWTIPWNDINSYEEPEEKAIKNITKKLDLVYTDIDPKERIIKSNTSSKIELNNNSREVERNVPTNIKIPGVIIIKYLDEDGNEIIESIKEEELVGEKTVVKPKEKEGYKLIEEPLIKDYEFKEEEQIVIYRYEKIKLDINTETTNEGGSITGEEKVPYGDSSTKDKIVITADEGYVIDKVIIDGKEIKIANNLKNLTLDNFTDVKDNHNVSVAFKKYNPNTNGNITIIIPLIIVISMIIFISTKQLKRKAN